MAAQQPSGGANFSLFPSPSSSKSPPVTGNNIQTPLSCRSESRERREPTPQQWHQEGHASSPNLESSLSSPSAPQVPLSSPPQNGRQTPLQQRSHTPLEFDPSRGDVPLQDSADGGQTAIPPEEQRQDALGVGYGHVPFQQPQLTIEIPGRTETAFSQAQTLIGGNSSRSRNSIAKPPLSDGPSSSSGQQQQQVLRSIFPTYDPGLPLDQQNYAPTQMGPSQFPRAMTSRQSYSEVTESAQKHPTVRSHGRGESGRPHNPPVIPKTCTADQLRDLWKVANGWKASGSEGRVYCLELTQPKDAPVYTLSSASQPFYNLRLDPTSSSAYVSLTRHDPSKSYKAPKSASRPSTSSILSGAIGGSSRGSESKYWQEVLFTTLEEGSRKHRPNDGLVALLMPAPATKIASERENDPLSVATAEREYASLVWDDDSASHFLVHSALSTPFCVTVEHCPAWSRVEYTLEHHESPQHLAKLTRDGTGGGWLEVDTSVASKIEAFYIVDVAVTALLLVAAADIRRSPAAAAAAETFEAPPVPEPPKQDQSRGSALSPRRDDDGGKNKSKNKKHKKHPRWEQFEMDIESQNESLGKKSKTTKAEDKLPFIIRVIVKLAKGIFNCFICLLTMVFTGLKGMLKVFFKCVGSKY